MRVLSAGFCLIHTEGAVIILLAVMLDNVILCGHERLVGQAQRVGSHIGYKADGAEALNVDALIKLLGDGHGAAGRHAEPAGGLLLEGGGYKRGRGTAVLLAALYALNGEGLILGCCYDLVYLSLGAQLKLLVSLAVKTGGKARVAAFAAEYGVKQPVFLADEASYLFFAVDDHSRSNGLHASR